MINKPIFTTFILILLTASGFGQTSRPIDLPSNSNTTPDTQAINRETDRLLKEGTTIPFGMIGNVSSESKLKAAKKMESDILKGDAIRLQAPAEYATNNAAGLKDKRAALARVYADKGCYSSATVSVNQADDCAEELPIWGGGSFYSFRLKTNVNQKMSWATGAISNADRADIHYINGRFLVGSESVQGLIAEVANVNFDSLNKNSPEIKALKEYKPDNEAAKFINQREAIRRGIVFDGYNYSDSVAAKVGSTYILRSIAYRMIAPSQGLTDEQFFPVMISLDIFDLRTDSIVAFQIVGKEKDGSLILLWKELNQKDAPIFKRTSK
jgi:hypothetical protein